MNYEKENAAVGLVGQNKVLGATKPSPLNEANARLLGEITNLQDVVDSLFVALQPVLALDQPTDAMSEPQQTMPARSEQVGFTFAQAERVAGIRNRLNHLKDRLEV